MCGLPWRSEGMLFLITSSSLSAITRLFSLAEIPPIFLYLIYVDAADQGGRDFSSSSLSVCTGPGASKNREKLENRLFVIPTPCGGQRVWEAESTVEFQMSRRQRTFLFNFVMDIF